MYRKKAYASIFVLLAIFILFVSVPPVKTQFVLAEWDYPDEYGQGIRGIQIYENSSGSWVQFYYCHYDDSYDTYDWNESVGIKLIVHTMLNSTLVGAADSDEAKLYQRHSVTVLNKSGAVIFSQQNFTYVDVNNETYHPLWLYRYEVIFDFLPELMQVYTATVIYEIFW